MGILVGVPKDFAGLALSVYTSLPWWEELGGCPLPSSEEVPVLVSNDKQAHKGIRGHQRMFGGYLQEWFENLRRLRHPFFGNLSRHLLVLLRLNIGLDMLGTFPSLRRKSESEYLGETAGMATVWFEMWGAKDQAVWSKEIKLLWWIV